MEFLNFPLIPGGRIWTVTTFGSALAIKDVSLPLPLWGRAARFGVTGDEQQGGEQSNN
jgi:hypothetical protein